MEFTDQPRRYYNFEFTGRAGEYFRIWIVNILLTIATLGIYSAWAKVRTNRYFYGNTILDGSAFDYTADPKKILVGRLIAVFLLIASQLVVMFSGLGPSVVMVIMALAVPPIIVMSLAFKMRYSSWRGINFSFQRDFAWAYLLFVPVLIYVGLMVAMEVMFAEQIQPAGSAELQPAATPSADFMKWNMIVGAYMFLCMILFPWWQSKYYGFIGNRTSFGQSRLKFLGSSWDFYQFYLGAFGLGVAAGLVVVILMSTLSAMFLGSDNAGLGLAGMAGMFLLVFPAFLFVQAMVIAYVQTHRTNVVYGNLEVEDVCFISELEFRRMLYLYITNTLAIMFSLGLAIPWAKVRMARYRAETMRLYADDFDKFVADSQHEADAKADAMSDVFDLDIGL